MGRKYKKVKDGELVHTTRKGHKISCCDCGLVHTMKFAHVPYGSGRTVVFRAWRDNRATANIRRGLKRKREGVYDDSQAGR